MHRACGYHCGRIRSTRGWRSNPTDIARKDPMNKLLSILVASIVAAASAHAIAADPPKDAPAAKAAPAKLEKPADVSAEAWAKMTDAEKQKAVDKAKAATAEPKKPKKGGC